MRRPSERCLPFAAAAALAALGTARAAAADPPPLSLARVSLAERRVELSGARATAWQLAREGAPVRTGESLRTGEDATVRLDLPWMSLTLGPEAAVRFPDAAVLEAALEAGRALVEAKERDALKLVTEEAEVHGRGRAVVRRGQRGVTTVSCLAGRFQVVSSRGTVALAAGQGTLVRAGRAPSAPEPLPPSPHEGLWPAKDPVYVLAGARLELRWKADPQASYHVELLPVGSDVVLLQRDVATAPLLLDVPWEGAFRWRVSARDARGVEGAPSDDGLIAVEPKQD